MECGDLEPLAAPYAHDGLPCSGPGQVVTNLQGGEEEMGGVRGVQGKPSLAHYRPPAFPLPPLSVSPAFTSCSSLTSSRAAMKPG